MRTSKASPSRSANGSLPSGIQSPLFRRSLVESRASSLTHSMKTNSFASLANGTSSAWINRTLASAQSGFQITLKSRQGPCGSFPIKGSSPENITGFNRLASSVVPSARNNVMPSPSITVRMRCRPGKAENGPSLATSAMERRKIICPCASWRKTSRVTPPLFFQGCVTKSANRKILTFNRPPSVVLDLQANLAGSNGTA